MQITNILAEIIHIYKVLDNVPITGVTELVKNIIEFFANSFGGYIAIGILIFSLILKIIPLPLDIYSKVATKKNGLKMERMRPELEKLQKQYANNKELYSQKMMALYKKEGYSTFSACLPTIFTLVFFIIVISAFTQYSTFSKIETFNKMAIAYSDSIRESDDVEIRFYDVDENNKIIDKETRYQVIKNKRSQESDPNKIVYEELSSSQYFRVDTVLKEGKDLTAVKTKAQDAAAEVYIEITEKHKFLWVQNIWIEDLPWKKAFVEESVYTSDNFFSFSKGGCSCDVQKIETDIKDASAYKEITGSPKLNAYKERPNGYLILVVLSIGSMLLSQLLMNKTQKAQLELQSVDDSAKQTNKMMTWMMPIMFGYFSFMYTASFSLYLIVSTLFSTLSTLIINKIVEKKFEKQIKKEEEEKHNKRFAHLNKKADNKKAEDKKVENSDKKEKTENKKVENTEKTTETNIENK